MLTKRFPTPGQCTDPQDFYVLRHVVVKVLGIPLSEKARSQRLWFESIPQQDMIDHMCSTLMEQLGEYFSSSKNPIRISVSVLEGPIVSCAHVLSGV